MFIRILNLIVLFLAFATPAVARNQATLRYDGDDSYSAVVSYVLH